MRIPVTAPRLNSGEGGQTQKDTDGCEPGKEAELSLFDAAVFGVSVDEQLRDVVAGLEVDHLAQGVPFEHCQ